MYCGRTGTFGNLDCTSCYQHRIHIKHCRDDHMIRATLLKFRNIASLKEG
jgi:hypothetical protein